MKKIIASFMCAALTICLFTSCIPSRELNNIAIVQAMGIDLNGDDIELTLQIFSSQGSGSNTAIDISVNNAVVITTTGKTVAEALRNATLLQGKQISMGHNRLVIIGRELAKKGIESVLRFFDRNSLIRQNVQFMLAENTAKEIITVNIVEDIIAAEVIEKMIENSSENGYIYKCPYYILGANMYEHNGAGAMPVISLQAQQTNESKSSSGGGSEGSGSKEISSLNIVKIENTGIFCDYKLIDVLDSQQTRGLIFLSDYLKQTLILVEDDLTASLHVFSCKSTLKPQINDEGEVTFVFDAALKASVDELITEREVVLDDDMIKLLEEKAAEIVSDECTAAFERAVNQDKCDLLYMCDLIEKKDKKYFDSIEDNFEETMTTMKLKTNVNLSISKTGLEANK